MAALQEVLVPDIGDFKNIPVIELLVKPGDRVKAEDALITLESDKATMEVPAPAAGVVKDLRVKVGDKVSEGSLILLLEGAAAATRAESPAARAEAPKPATPVSPPAATSKGSARAVVKGDLHAEVVVLGSGPGGYTAAFRAAGQHHLHAGRSTHRRTDLSRRGRLGHRSVHIRHATWPAVGGFPTPADFASSGLRIIADYSIFDYGSSEELIVAVVIDDLIRSSTDLLKRASDMRSYL